MSLHIVAPETASPLLVELRTSIEAGTVTWALAQADYALKGRAIPTKITDLHHDARRRYEDAAVLALMLLNRDAEIYAEAVGADVAFGELEQFCKARDLDWFADAHPANEGDALEVAIHTAAKKAIRRFWQVLIGVYPGLSGHLVRLERARATAGEEEVYDRR